MTSDKLELRVGDYEYVVAFETIKDSRKISQYTLGAVNAFRIADAVKCTIEGGANGVWLVGYAFRTHNDLPDFREGAKIAFGKALKSRDKDERRELWRAYLAARPVRPRQFDALRRWLSTQSSPTPKPTRRVPAITQQEES